MKKSCYVSMCGLLHILPFSLYGHAFGLADVKLEAEARFNMPAALQKCTTLEEIEAVLRAEEERMLNEIRRDFKVSGYQWWQCMTEINARMQYHRHITYKIAKSNKDHSLQLSDPEGFKRITQALETYGISPDSVDIVFDKKSGSKAYGQSSYGTYEAKIHYTPMHDTKIKSASVYYQKYYRSICPMHEAMHIYEQHSLQRDVVRTYLMRLGYTLSAIEKQQSYKNWCRSQEKIADLMPLLRSKDSEIVDMAFDISLYACSLKTKKINWNTSPDENTHPCDCSEQWPFVLKMRELILQEQAKKDSIDDAPEPMSML
jgi:hypothetical protein